MLVHKIVPRFSLEELRTFVAVVELGSFSLAADNLNRTTAAVSYRVKMLESNLGTPLFDRHTREVKLTEAGEWLYAKATELLIWQQGIPDEVSAIKNGVESRFTLVINNLLYDPKCVAGLISTMKKEFPYTQIKVIRSVFMGVWDSLMHDGGTLAVGAPTFHAVDNRYVTDPLGVISWHLVVSPFHPLAQKRNVTENDLRQYPVVNIEDSSYQLQKRSPWRLSGQDEIIVPDLRTKVACHVDGLGIGFLPYSIVESLLESGKLVELKTDSSFRASSPMALAWARKDNGVINQWMRRLIKQKDPLVRDLLAPLS